MVVNYPGLRYGWGSYNMLVKTPKKELNRELDRIEFNFEFNSAPMETITLENGRHQQVLCMWFCLLKSSGEKCSICKEHFSKESSIQCDHTFCFDCIRQWTYANSTCPLCRIEVNEIKIVSNGHCEQVEPVKPRVEEYDDGEIPMELLSGDEALQYAIELLTDANREQEQNQQLRLFEHASQHLELVQCDLDDFIVSDESDEESVVIYDDDFHDSGTSEKRDRQCDVQSPIMNKKSRIFHIKPL